MVTAVGTIVVDRLINAEAPLGTVTVGVFDIELLIPVLLLVVVGSAEVELEQTLGEIEGALGDEVDAAADRVALHVGRHGFHELDAREALGRITTHAVGPVVVGVADTHAVEGDRVKLRGETADIGAHGLVRADFEVEAGHRLEDFADFAEAGIGERIERGDLADVLGVLLEIQRLRLPFGLRGDHEFLHGDDFGREAQRERRSHAREHGDGKLLRIGAGRVDPQAVVARREGAEEEFALAVSDGSARGAHERELGALDEITRGVVEDNAPQGGRRNGLGVRRSEQTD